MSSLHSGTTTLPPALRNLSWSILSQFMGSSNLSPLRISSASGFIEAHHTKALASLTENSMTKLEDLALVCANCHWMIHAQKPWLSIQELRAILR